MPQPAVIDQRDTHRLIPAQYADGGASVLTRLTDDVTLLDGLFELDNATNDRLLAESDLLPGIDARELVFGIPSYRIINAAFCHCAKGGSRFASADRNAWYAGFELETSQAEVGFHKQLWLAEVGWLKEEIADYADYLADFHAEFHDLRNTTEHLACLTASIDYGASQALGAMLLSAASAGIVYLSSRQASGTCLVCFRPVLVTNARCGSSYRFVFPAPTSPPIVSKL